MAIEKRVVGSWVLVAALIMGIVAAWVFLWEPRIAGQGQVVGNPPAPYWSVAGSDQLTFDAGSASISVHDILVSPNHVTVVYSAESSSSEVSAPSLTGKSTLVDESGSIVYRATQLNTMISAGGFTLGTVTFDSYRLGSSELRLRVPEIKTGNGSEEKAVVLDEGVEVLALTRLRPNDATGRMFRMSGASRSRGGSVADGPFGGFVGSSPQGQIATVSYDVSGSARYFLVKQHGNVQELSESQVAGIKDYLGIP